MDGIEWTTAVHRNFYGHKVDFIKSIDLFPEVNWTSNLCLTYVNSILWTLRGLIKINLIKNMGGAANLQLKTYMFIVLSGIFSPMTFYRIFSL